MTNVDVEYYEGLLRQIGDIVRTPTKATAYRKATDHYQADFDMIRKIVAIGLTRPVGPSPHPGASSQSAESAGGQTGGGK